MSTARTAAPYRVALLGYGLAGAAFHAPLIATTPGLRLTAVVTANPERRARLAAAHPDARPLDSPAQVFDRADQYDLVVIATPNRTHLPLARAALTAGLATVVDKPLTATAAEARSLCHLADTRGTLLTVFQNRRWDNDFRTVRRLIEDGALGRVHRFESRFERFRPKPKAGWRELADPAEAAAPSTTWAATWWTRRSPCSARSPRSTPRSTSAGTARWWTTTPSWHSATTRASAPTCGPAPPPRCPARACGCSATPRDT